MMAGDFFIDDLQFHAIQLPFPLTNTLPIMRHKSFILLAGLLSICNIAYSQEQAGTSFEFGSLLLPAVIAVAGYILKSIYEIVIERQKRKRALLEEKLKKFYWPIMTRLEKTHAVWLRIFKNRHVENSVEGKIAHYVEKKEVLKNHEEIVAIITDNRHLAEFDAELVEVIGKYLEHVTIYKAIIDSNEKTFPGLLGAPYPKSFDEMIRVRTEKLQKKLDSSAV